jgi:hypothetical protein
MGRYFIYHAHMYKAVIMKDSQEASRLNFIILHLYGLFSHHIFSEIKSIPI